MTQPTWIVNDQRLLAGAWEFYYWTSLASLVRLGAYRDATIESKRESSELVFDNAKTNKFKKGTEFSFKFKLAEIDPDHRYVNTFCAYDQSTSRMIYQDVR